MNAAPISANYDVAIVGAGMMGSSAARWLAKAGLKVIAIGPAEPEDWARHNGVFASHYDQGRITRITDADYVWGWLARASIAEYAAIERESGIKFHHPSGQLRVSPNPDAPGDTLALSAEHGKALGAVFEMLNRRQLRLRFPYLRFPAKAEGLHEQGQAGYVNPRALVAAQLRAAELRGARVLREEVTGFSRVKNEWRIATTGGARVSARRVLLATGGFTNLLDGVRLRLQAKPRTVLMAALDADEQRRLAALPTLIWRLENHGYYKSFYSASPTQYPDGTVRFKIGGEHITTPLLSTREEFITWFQSPGHPREIEELRAITLDILPGLRVASWHTKPCVTTFTVQGYPYIGALDDGLFTCIGGCGAAAKSCVEIGQVAASLVQHNAWVHPLEQKLFEIVKE